jgi:crossover junction endodeoxyribonuclease RusA
MNELVLPWPSRDLHPNSRVHWTWKAKASKAAKLHAGLLALEQGWNRIEWPEGHLHVWIDGYPTDKRRRDADGLLSSLKPHLDAIASVMGVDDQRFVPHPMVKDEVRKGGEVRIRITSGPAA